MPKSGKPTDYSQADEAQQEQDTWALYYPNTTNGQSATLAAPSSAPPTSYEHPYATVPGSAVYGASAMDTVFSPAPYSGQHPYAASNAASMAVNTGASRHDARLTEASYQSALTQKQGQAGSQAQGSQNPLNLPPQLYQQLQYAQQQREQQEAERKRREEEEWNRAQEASRQEQNRLNSQAYTQHVLERTARENTFRGGDVPDDDFWKEDDDYDGPYDWEDY